MTVTIQEDSTAPSKTCQEYGYKNGWTFWQAWYGNRHSEYYVRETGDVMGDPYTDIIRVIYDDKGDVTAAHFWERGTKDVAVDRSDKAFDKVIFWLSA